MITCTADGVLELSKCFRCVDKGNLPDLSLALACVAAGGTPPVPHEQIVLGDPDVGFIFGDPTGGIEFGIP